MADMIRVNTDLLERCAGELRQAAHGFGDAAAILAGLNTGEEWWSKMGRFNALSLQDEGACVQLGDGGAAVRSLATVLRRYDDRMTRLGDSTARTASMFKSLEWSLQSKAGGQDAGADAGIIGALGAVGQVGAVAGVAAGLAKITGARPVKTTKKVIRKKKETSAKKKRARKARLIKFLVGATAVVASVAVVVLSGGTALPVIATGVVAGAVTTGVNSAADQYVEKGWDNINWADVGKDAVIGGIVGGVTSAISMGGSAVANQAVARVTGQITPYVSSATGRIATHVIGGVTSSVIAGTATRAGGEAVRQYLNDGSVDWGQVKDRALDPTAITVDAVMGGVTGYKQGRRYNDQVKYEQEKNLILRDEKYRCNNPYSKDYGGPDWDQYAPNGGIDAGKPVVNDYEIPEGTILRRTGPESGGYLRNVEDSYESASMPYVKKGSNEHLYRVIKPIPGTTKSTAAPGFDMPGGATQYELPGDWNVGWLFDNHYIERLY